MKNQYDEKTPEGKIMNAFENGLGYTELKDKTGLNDKEFKKGICSLIEDRMIRMDVNKYNLEEKTK